MKKFLAFALAAAMTLGLALPAFASELPSCIDQAATYQDNAGNGAHTLMTLLVNDGSNTPLNYGGNIMEIQVNAVGTDTWLPSFCAHGGSTHFASANGLVYSVANDQANQAGLAAATAALNYIYNKYGSLDNYYGYEPSCGWDAFSAVTDTPKDYPGQNGGGYWGVNNITDWTTYAGYMGDATRILSQIAVWHFYCGVDFTANPIQYYTPAGSGYVPDQYRAAIDDLLANGATGTGNISLAYLAAKNADGTWADTTANQPQLVPYKCGKYISVTGSITGGYAGKNIANLAGILMENANWFQYVTYDPNGPASQHYDLVQGNNLTKVGGFTVTLAGGVFTVTLDGTLAAGSANLSVANNIAAAKNAKSAAANTIWTTSPGQQTVSFTGNSGTISAAGVDTSKPVFVYLHMKDIAGYIS